MVKARPSMMVAMVRDYDNLQENYNDETFNILLDGRAELEDRDLNYLDHICVDNECWVLQ